MSFEALLDKTMTIRREGSVSANAFGGRSGTWADAYTLVPCRLQQTDAEEITNVDEGSRSLVADKQLWFGYGVDLRAGDRVVVGGITYEVNTVDTDVAGAGHHGSATLVEVRS